MIVIADKDSRVAKASLTYNEMPNNATDFYVCLDIAHAGDLLLAFADRPSESPNLLPQIMEKSLPPYLSHRISNFALHLSEVKRAVQSTHFDAIIAGMCVVVDLCRPYRYATHTVQIYNGHTRSHSNDREAANPSMSYISDRTDVPTWCPHQQSGKGVIGADFVEICRSLDSNGHYDWSIEGVVIQTDGPVAVKVDIQVHGTSKDADDLQVHGLEFKYPDSGDAGTDDNDWLPVANGALLRPCRNMGIRFKDR